MKRITVHDPDPAPGSHNWSTEAPHGIGHPTVDRGRIGIEIDPASFAGRYLLAYQAALIEHVGGSPSVVQRFVIERCSRIALHLELLDERSLLDGVPLSQHDMNHYCAWSNALTRTLIKLGLSAAAKPQQNLADLLRARPGRAARAVIYDSDSDGYDA